MAKQEYLIEPEHEEMSLNDIDAIFNGSILDAVQVLETYPDTSFQVGEKPVIYLAGPITGKNPEGEKWRKDIFEQFSESFTFINPEVHAYKLMRSKDLGKIAHEKYSNVTSKCDKANVLRADAVLANCSEGPSYGTAMGIHFAYLVNRAVAVLYSDKSNSTKPLSISPLIFDIVTLDGFFELNDLEPAFSFLKRELAFTFSIDIIDDLDNTKSALDSKKVRQVINKYLSRAPGISESILRSLSNSIFRCLQIYDFKRRKLDPYYICRTSVANQIIRDQIINFCVLTRSFEVLNYFMSQLITQSSTEAESKALSSANAHFSSILHELANSIGLIRNHYYPKLQSYIVSTYPSLESNAELCTMRDKLENAYNLMHHNMLIIKSSTSNEPTRVSPLAHLKSLIRFYFPNILSALNISPSAESATAILRVSTLDLILREAIRNIDKHADLSLPVNIELARNSSWIYMTITNHIKSGPTYNCNTSFEMGSSLVKTGMLALGGYAYPSISENRYSLSLMFPIDSYTCLHSISNTGTILLLEDNSEYAQIISDAAKSVSNSFYIHHFKEITPLINHIRTNLSLAGSSLPILFITDYQLDDALGRLQLSDNVIAEVSQLAPIPIFLVTSVPEHDYGIKGILSSNRWVRYFSKNNIDLIANLVSAISEMIDESFNNTSQNSRGDIYD